MSIRGRKVQNRLARHVADVERRNEQLDAMLRLQMVTARGAIALVDRLKGQLKEIRDNASLECGCMPCMGACYDKATLREVVEVIRRLADKGIAMKGELPEDAKLPQGVEAMPGVLERASGTENAERVLQLNKRPGDLNERSRKDQ